MGAALEIFNPTAMLLHIQNYINGQLQPALSGQSLPNYEPAAGTIYGTLPDSSAMDVEMAVAAAKEAFPVWSAMPVAQRAAILNKVADLMEARLPELAQAESRDQGKPVALAMRMDIPRAVDNFRFFASAIQHAASESHSTDGMAINYTLRQPLGVVACISPWNLPLYLFT